MFDSQVFAELFELFEEAGIGHDAGSLLHDILQAVLETAFVLVHHVGDQ